VPSSPSRLLAILSLGLLTLFAGCGKPSVSEQLKQAQAQIDAGHADLALKQLQQLHASAPKDDSVTEALAFAELNNGSAKDAGDLFSALGVANNADDLLYAAQAYKKANESDKAIDAYRLYLLSEPKQANAWNELGELLVSSKQLPDGIEALEKANELSPTPELSERIGVLYKQEGNAIQAQRYLQSALSLLPASPTGQEPPAIKGDILAELSDLSLKDQKISEAERHIRQMERDFPKHEKLASLKERLAKAQSLAETTAKSRDLPKAEELQGKLEEAPALIPVRDPAMEALERDLKNVEHWKALAREKAKVGDWAWAEAAYLETMRLQPGDGPTILAYLDVVKHRRTGAAYLQEAERQLAKHSDIPELYLLAARDYRDMELNKRNAFFIFKEFLQKFPNHPEAAHVRVELEALH